MTSAITCGNGAHVYEWQNEGARPYADPEHVRCNCGERCRCRDPRCVEALPLAARRPDQERVRSYGTTSRIPDGRCRDCFALEHAGECDGDAIGEDVQANHVDHMIECPRCTWSRCEHYPCDCGLFELAP